MFFRKKLIFLFFYLISISYAVYAEENKILFKINNKIITTIDILNEVKYLSLINSDFKNTDKNIKIEIAKNSLIREKIKNLELINLNLNFQINDDLFGEIIKNNFKTLKLKNIEEFNFFCEKNNLEPLIIKRKIITEVMWRQLVYKKFIQRVSIDRNEIKQDILNKNIQKEYLLSEILVLADEKEKLDKKLEKIYLIIKEKNFSVAALNYSISDTSKNGGKLDWIRESVLNDKIKEQLNHIMIGEITKPITIPGGFLILKIEDIREIEIKSDINKQVEIIVEKKTNEQLNMFSNIYFNKLKKDTIIDEF